MTNHPWSISATSSADLAVAFSSVGRRVNIRPSLDKFEKEAWVLRRCILALAEDGRLSFPLNIERGQPRNHPDFWMCEGMLNGQFPLEVTEATWPADARERAIRRASGAGGFLGTEGGRGGGGMKGFEPELLCVADICEAVKRKAKKRYACSEMTILIYVNSNPGFLAHTDTLAKLLHSSGPAEKFGFRVHILHDGHVIADAMTDQQAIIPLPEIAM